MDFRRLLTVAILATALMLVYYSNHSFTFTNEVLVTTNTTIHQALAQVPPIPTPPEIDDETIAGIQPPTTDSGQSQLPQSATPPNTSIPPTPTIQITSHQDGSQVPVGELTIQGTSSDNPESNCQVYADANDIAPLQNATASGANGGDDYSQWTFTYTQDYQLITQGANELTAKISCFDSGITAMPLSEWHSVNVTGVVNGVTVTSIPSPTPTLPATQLPTTDEGPGAELGGSFIPSPVTPPSLPFATSEQPSGDLSQSGGLDSDDDDDDDDDDEGDDVEGDDDDDGGEGDGG